MFVRQVLNGYLRLAQTTEFKKRVIVDFNNPKYSGETRKFQPKTRIQTMFIAIDNNK